MNNWTTEKACTTYRVHQWGLGYFDVNSLGNLCVRPDPQRSVEIDLFELSQEIKRKNFDLPVLVRFSDILGHRVNAMVQAFERAKARSNYQGHYRPVYPIKVNQQHRVISDLLNLKETAIGLEAGSKSELLAVLASAKPSHNPIICNGYKDREYLRLALIGTRIGHDLTIVLEKRNELDLVIKEAARLGVRPRLGVRLRLSTSGAGKWQNSGGELAKFGFMGRGVLEIVNQLRQIGMLDCLQLLHFHLGSQIADISGIGQAVAEGAQFYCELHRLGAPIDTLDVGGGLGIDYEGSNNSNFCSMNYDLDAYADCVVSGLTNHCRERNVAHPNILTEAGRAMTAHHAVLITNVIDVDPADQAPSFQLPDTDEHPLLQALLESKRQLNMNNAAAVARKSRQLLNELQQDFINNHTTLEQRAQGEGTYALITEQARDFLRHSGEDSGLLDELNERLARKYFCNYSLFQSMPDAWAIDQIFPILPLHRLNEEPDQRGIIEDITCDSDGRINLYVDAKGIEHSLPLHAPRPGEPYLLGFFLVGAYQEILGDMHNLFGDTHSINVRLDSSGKVLLEEPLAGDNVGDLLRYVHFDPENLIASLRLQLQASQASESEQQQMLAELTEGMHGYSYFED